MIFPENETLKVLIFVSKLKIKKIVDLHSKKQPLLKD